MSMLRWARGLAPARAVRGPGCPPVLSHSSTIWRRPWPRLVSTSQENTPTLIDPQLVRDVDVVVTLGREARVDPVPGTRFEYWDTDEPSERGIDGIERMRLVRDDIADRVADLLDRVQTRSC
jgi:hypothetical protein